VDEHLLKDCDTG